MKLTTIVTALAAANAISFNVVDRIFQSSVPDRVLKVAENSFVAASEADKLRLRREGKRFIDVTDSMPVDEAVRQGLVAQTGHSGTLFSWFAKNIDSLKRPVAEYNYPTEASQNKLVESLLEKLTLRVSRATWPNSLLSIHDIVRVLPNDAFTIRKFKHNGWDQYSIAVSLKGEVEDKVVVGAHQDSINLLFPNLLRAPGADDDGSGTVTTLEALRLVSDAIAAGKFTPYNTLEFHYYSAEEGGLLGSIDVFSKYYTENATVVGMLQQDMTGYTQGTIDAGVEPHFGLISDYTSVRLNDFIKLIVSNYCAIPYHETECGYACSDHASALENGYPASFLIESEFKYTAKQIHSTMDTMDRLDFDHIKEHVKLTVGFAVELSSAQHL
ncbi:hypothetical protein CJJ09_004265 [Candidozyma auris]|nr:hypothetical protein CJJ09_004265 [[Candida] auris]